MAIYASIPTGNVWPGDLIVSKLDAPAGSYKLDPTLPIVGVDGRFQNKGIVIGRGRLIGLKKDAAIVNGEIKTTEDHISFITAADGVDIAPLGFAATNMYKESINGLADSMNTISKNAMIAVPFVAGVNDAYGMIQPGDPVTAYKSQDPKLKGSIVKWIGRQVNVATGSAGSVTLTGSFQAQPPFSPVILVAYAADNSIVAGATAVWDATSKTFMCKTATVTRVLYAFGLGAEMIAGNAFGVETINNLPGFLKWVSDNYGAWQLPSILPSLYDGPEEEIALTEGAYDGFVAPAEPVKLDGGKRIAIKAAGTFYGYVNGAIKTFGAGDILPGVGGDFNPVGQGMHYMVDITTGTVRYFGLYSDAQGTTPLTAAQAASLLVLVATPEGLGATVDLGAGQITAPGGIPTQYLKDGLTGTYSVGILRAAIR